MKKTEKKKRNPYWDNVKGILVILVVLGHLLELMAGRIPGALYLWSMIYSFHMPAFLIISGYFAKRSQKNKLDNAKKYFCLYLLV